MSCDGGLSLQPEPESEYLRTVESSTCLLLPSPSPTPTPPHPLTDIDLLAGEDACSEHLHTEDVAADCSSSGSSTSVTLHQDPVSAQLINNISMLEYQSLGKTDHSADVENADSKVVGAVNGSGRPLPGLMEWNWVLVRRVMVWVVVSGLVACSAAVVAMLATLPAACDPHLPWFHGTLFYEVFTASFHDSNNDVYGDLRGLTNRLDYIEDLGAKAIRLNYIFEANEYPEHYTQIINSTSIAASIGTMKDFRDLVEEVHRRNMSIVLDIPVTNLTEESNVTLVDSVAHTLAFWSSLRVDGFYLKGLENFVRNHHFENSLTRWKQAIDFNKILIVSYDTFLKSTSTFRTSLLSKVDLIDVPLRLKSNTESIKKQIDDILSGPLFTNPTYPWVHWNVGDVESERLGGGADASDASSMLLLALSLPGTVSIFYGDEIGLRGLSEESERDFPERSLVHALVAMRWSSTVSSDGGCDVSAGRVLPWNCGVEFPDFDRLETVKRAVRLRRKTPTLYTCWTQSENAWRGNAGTRPAPAPALVLERWLPRRHSYVFLANPASSSLHTDLSTAFYAGTVVAATNATSVGKYLYFNEVALLPHEALIVQLEK